MSLPAQRVRVLIVDDSALVRQVMMEILSHGGSFGGGAAGDASIKAAAGEIDRIVFLGAAPNLPADKLKSRALFIVARDDSNGAGPRLPGIRAQYEKAPQPKELIVVDGSAHAQFLFETDQGDRVMREILRFLSKP